MKLFGPLVLSFVACCFASQTAEQKLDSQPLVDLRNLRNNLKTKNEAVGRFIKLLYGNTAADEKQRSDEPDSKLSLISRSFRRLNIFGLQAPPDEPKRNSDGVPYGTKDSAPEILFVMTTAEYVQGPSFSIVVPEDSIETRIDKSVEMFEPIKNHYPKLNIKELQQQQTNDLPQRPTKDLFEPNYYQGFPSGYHQQPFALH